MAWTTPRTWTTGELVTKTIMDTHVRDNFNWLAGFGIGGTDFGSLAAQHTSISRVAVGSYTGNVTDNRSITGVGFQPVAMFIKSASASYSAQWRFGTVGDLSGGVTTDAPTTDRIQAFESDGFQIGAANQVNASGITNYYVCWG
jgi:hypothetical protein